MFESWRQEVKRIKFEEALAGPEEPVISAFANLDPSSVAVEEGYAGPRMALVPNSGPGGPDQYQITGDFVAAMLEEFRAQRMVHRRFVLEILVQVSLHFVLNWRDPVPPPVSLIQQPPECRG